MELITTAMHLLARLKPYAPLIVRLTLGVVFVAHGLDKFFDLFGSGGFQATAAMFDNDLGLHPGWFHAAVGSTGELVGGILILLGLFTRFGGMLIAGTMVVAILTVHLPNGLFARDGGFEYPLVCLGAALGLMLSGGGAFSLDRLLFGGHCTSGHCQSESATMA